MKHRLLLVCLAAFALSMPVAAEDGYDLWLRYRAVDAAAYPALAAGVTELVTAAATPTLAVAELELKRGLTALSFSQTPEVEMGIADRVIFSGTHPVQRASFVVGPLAASASNRHRIRPAFSAVMTRSNAAGINTVHSVSSNV